MKYTKLGNSELHVSRICLGCMGFGDAGSGMHSWTLSEDQSREIIAHALEAGITFFDTAAGYQGGTSEQFLGRTLKDLSCREDVVIATKFFPRNTDQFDTDVSGREHINTLLDRSLQNLGVDYIDLYICHAWDDHTPIEETMETLNTAVLSGKVREIGISNCYAWQLQKANYIAERNGWKQFVSMQGHYNLIFREEEREMIPYCEDAGIALTPYSPLASGRLVKPRGERTKRLEEDTYAKGKYASTEAQDAIIIDRVAEIAKRRSLTTTQVALAWLLSKVTAPIVGATKLSHIDDAASAVDAALSNDEITYLEQAYMPHKLVGVMANNHK